MLRLIDVNNNCSNKKIFINYNSAIHPGMIGYLNDENEIDLLQSVNSEPVILDDVRDDDLKSNTVLDNKICFWNISGSNSIKSFQTDVFEYDDNTKYTKGDHVYINNNKISLIPRGEPIGEIFDFNTKSVHVNIMNLTGD